LANVSLIHAVVQQTKEGLLSLFEQSSLRGYYIILIGWF
jgi:hypothetical protein